MHDGLKEMMFLSVFYAFLTGMFLFIVAFLCVLGVRAGNGFVNMLTSPSSYSAEEVSAEDEAF